MLQRHIFQPVHERLTDFIGEAELYESDDTLQNNSQLLISNQGTRPTGSFKVAGIGNQILYGLEEGARQFVLSSAGSAAMGEAYMIGMLAEVHPDIRGKANVPHDIAPERKQKILELGRGAVLVDSSHATFEEAHQATAQEAATNPEVKQLEPFNSLDMIAGNAYIIQALIEQIRQRTAYPLVLSIPTGGTGLLAGAASVALKRDDVRLVGAQYGSNISLEQSLAAGYTVATDHIDTTCAGSAVQTIGSVGFPFLKQAHERGILTTARVNRYELGKELFTDSMRREALAWAIGDIALEPFTEATGLLGTIAARSTEIKEGEVCVAIETGANPDHQKEGGAIDDYLQWQSVRIRPQSRQGMRGWNGAHTNFR